MMNRFVRTDKVGPILIGFCKSIHVLQLECDVQETKNMSAIAAMDSLEKK